jgi:hypothetical protein
MWAGLWNPLANQAVMTLAIICTSRNTFLSENKLSRPWLSSAHQETYSSRKPSCHDPAYDLHIKKHIPLAIQAVMTLAIICISRETFPSQTKLLCPWLSSAHQETYSSCKPSCRDPGYHLHIKIEIPLANQAVVTLAIICTSRNIFLSETKLSWPCLSSVHQETYSSCKPSCRDPGYHLHIKRDIPLTNQAVLTLAIICISRETFLSQTKLSWPWLWSAYQERHSSHKPSCHDPGYHLHIKKHIPLTNQAVVTLAIICTSRNIFLSETKLSWPWLSSAYQGTHSSRKPSCRDPGYHLHIKKQISQWAKQWGRVQRACNMPFKNGLYLLFVTVHLRWIFAAKLWLGINTYYKQHTSIMHFMGYNGAFEPNQVSHKILSRQNCSSVWCHFMWWLKWYT